MSPAALLYDALVPLGALAAVPFYLARSLAHPEYRAHFGERLGLLPPGLAERLRALSRSPLWIQAVSVGEVVLARRLIEGLAAAGCRVPVVLSSTTPAGRDMAATVRSAAVAGVFHFPIDWSPFLRRALDTVRPAAFACVETELWPGLLSECSRREIPALIVNGRLSERSWRRLRRFGGLMRGPLRAVRLACMQSEADAERARSLGLPPDRIFVSGNMKFDAPGLPAAPDDLRAFLGLPDCPAARVLVAGSTSPGEERTLLDALEILAGEDVHGITVILAPRHRERFGSVADLLASRGVSFVRRSQLPRPEAVTPAGRPDLRVILLDTLGELPGVYGLGTVAFVGGSLVPRGGQNMIEPAACGLPVLFGPHTQNFADIAHELLAAGAGFLVTDARSLAVAIRRLITDRGLRERSGAAGRALIEAHRGATGRTIDRILQYVQ